MSKTMRIRQPNPKITARMEDTEKDMKWFLGEDA
jgi:hypothetical protein